MFRNKYYPIHGFDFVIGRNINLIHLRSSKVDALRWKYSRVIIMFWLSIHDQDKKACNENLVFCYCRSDRRAIWRSSVIGNLQAGCHLKTIQLDLYDGRTINAPGFFVVFNVFCVYKEYKLK